MRERFSKEGGAGRGRDGGGRGTYDKTARYGAPRKPFGAKPAPTSTGARILHEGSVLIYGLHSVSAALANPNRTLYRLYASENGQNRLNEANVTIGCPIEIMPVKALDKMLTPDAVHQGMVLECAPLEFLDFSQLPHAAIVLVLDQVTDPHNIGAIFRTAAAFDVSAIITTHRFSPLETGVLAKSASGALELVPWIRVTNLSSTVDELKDQGFLCVGLDSEAPADLAHTKIRAPLALVLGAEGKGLRQKTRDTCDVLARIDLPGKIKSLNVSNAAVLSLERARTALELK